MSDMTEVIERYIAGLTHTFIALISPLVIYFQGDIYISGWVYLCLYLLSGIDPRLGIFVSLIFIHHTPFISLLFLICSCIEYLISRFPSFILYLSTRDPKIFGVLLSISKTTRDLVIDPHFIYSTGLVLIFTRRGMYVGRSVFSNCCICLTENIRSIQMECGHSFCVECSSEYLSINNRCPLCRKLL